MALRHNHYEAAFEQWLRERQAPYVAVNEARRALHADSSLKSLDFIVSTAQGRPWLVDVKGRLFPAGRQRRRWTNWSTRDDLDSLARWENLFGESLGGLFVFAYQVVGEKSPLPADELFHFRGARYGFFGIRLRDYLPYARVISPRWDTLAIPTSRFRELALPMSTMLAG